MDGLAERSWVQWPGQCWKLRENRRLSSGLRRTTLDGLRSRAGWPEPLSTPRVVACVDGSDESEQALPLAASWARSLGMSLTIVTVVEDTPDPIRPAPAQARYGGHGDAETYIDELVERWSGQGPKTRGDVVRDPLSAASGMRTYLDQHPAGLVVVATHARSGMDRVRHGAIAASIVNASTAPCLVAPMPPETETT